MTKLAIVFSLALATPVLACPNMGHDETPAPKTAEKDQAPKAETAKPAKTKDTAATTKDQKPAEAKTKDAAKKPDKVSQN